MLHLRHWLVAVALGCTSMGMGCSGDNPEQGQPTDEQFASVVDRQVMKPNPGTQSLYGTWIGAALNGHFDLLVLMTNGRYHSEQTVVCVKAPCDPIAQDGTFKLDSDDASTFIEFQMPDGHSEKYEYLVSADSLRLREVDDGSDWFAMLPSSTAWCITSKECDLQNLPVPICGGRYECESNVCAWKCGTSGEPSAVPNQNTAEN